MGVWIICGVLSVIILLVGKAFRMNYRAVQVFHLMSNGEWWLPRDIHLHTKYPMRDVWIILHVFDRHNLLEERDHDRDLAQIYIEDHKANLLELPLTYFGNYPKEYRLVKGGAPRRKKWWSFDFDKEITVPLGT